MVFIATSDGWRRKRRRGRIVGVDREEGVVGVPLSLVHSLPPSLADSSSLPFIDERLCFFPCLVQVVGRKMIDALVFVYLDE